MKSTMNRISGLIAKTLKYVVMLAATFVGLFWIFMIYALVIDLNYELRHDTTFTVSFIPNNHLELLLRKKIDGTIRPTCAMIFQVTGTDVYSEDVSELLDYEIVSMGKYPQNDVVEEPIEWLIVDEKCGRTLLLSKYSLDAVPYDDIPNEVTWAKSKLRRWLNDDFYHRAFDQQEQSEIKTTIIERDTHTIDGRKGVTLLPRLTRDKVFVLDPHEELIYLVFVGNDYRAEPTEYALQQSISITGNTDWTRDGAGSEGVLFVRPAMWVNSSYVRKLTMQDE